MNRKMLLMLSVVLAMGTVAGANTITTWSPDSLSVSAPTYAYPYVGHNSGTDDGVIRLLLDNGPAGPG